MAQFPSYTLNAFSYGTAVKKLYGIPVAVENIGLVVNTKLAKVPTTFGAARDSPRSPSRRRRRNCARHRRPAGRRRRRVPHVPVLLGPRRLHLRHEQGRQPRPVGHRRREHDVPQERAADRQVEQGGPDQLEGRLLDRAERLPEGPGCRTGSPARGTSTRSRRPGSSSRSSRSRRSRRRRCRSSASRASWSRSTRRPTATTPRRRTSSRTTCSTPSAQTQLAAANGRAPANTKAKASDPYLAQFGAAGKGGVPMPNIPQMDSVWRTSAQAWVKSTKGAGATQASALLPARSPQRSRTRSASSNEHGDGRPRGRPLRLRCDRREHDRRRPQPPQPATGLQAGAASRAGSRAFSGTAGLVIKIACSRVSNALAAWAGIRADRRTSAGCALAVLVAATALIDFLYLVPRRWTLPAKFLVPGTVFLIAFQIDPDRLHDQRRASRTTRPATSSRSSEAIEGIKVQLAPAAGNGRQYDDGGRARRERQARPAPARRRRAARSTSGRRTGCSRSPGSREGRGRRAADRAPRATRWSRAPSSSRSTRSSRRFTRSRPTGDSAIRPQGIDVAVELQPTLRYDAATTGSSGSATARSSPTTAGARSSPADRRGARAGLEDARRLRELRAHHPRPARPQAVPARLRLDVRLRDARPCFFSFAIGLFLAIALDKKGLRFQKLYRSVLVIPYAIPGFLSLLVWRGPPERRLRRRQPGSSTRRIPWLFDAVTGRSVSVIIVSIWLTTSLLLPRLDGRAAVDPRRS